MQKNITFLIGAGASVPAFDPPGSVTTRTITDTICESKEQDSYIPTIEYSDRYLTVLCKFIKNKINDYYKSRWDINLDVSYEDIYFLFNQIHADDLYEYPNPLLAQAFLDKYLNCLIKKTEELILPENQIGHNVDTAEFKDVLLATRYSDGDPWDSIYFDQKDIFKQLTEYIKAKVIDMLSSPMCFDKILPFWQAVWQDVHKKDSKYQRCDIFTLNHDVVFEQVFTNYGIQFNDGFEARLWNRELFDQDNSKIHLYKLHGSINWQYHEKGAKAVHAIENNQDIYYIFSRSKQEQAILIGTHDKMFEYAGNKIFLDLFHLFYRRLILEKADTLIVCGYGFRDRGVNNMIINWIYENDHNRMIIIDPSIAEIKTTKAFPAIRWLWEDDKAKGRLIEIPCKLENIAWDCVKEKMENY